MPEQDVLVQKSCECILGKLKTASLKEILWKYKLISYSDLKYFISELQYTHYTIQNLTSK